MQTGDQEILVREDADLEGIPVVGGIEGKTFDEHSQDGQRKVPLPEEAVMQDSILLEAPLVDEETNQKGDSNDEGSDDSSV